MKVYFSASLSRYRKLLPVTQDIALRIEKLGHEVTSKHVVKEETTQEGWEQKYDPHALYSREIQRLVLSDVLVTEATTPSFGAAFLIDIALQIGKPVLTLHYGLKEDSVPLMLRGNRRINLHIYTEETIKKILSDFFNVAQELVDKPLPDFDQ